MIYLDIQIGRVTHYYDKIGVAVVEVYNQPLNVGDRVKVSGHDKEFIMDITSLQVEHDKVVSVGVGETCGVKIDTAVKPGDILYLQTKK